VLRYICPRGAGAGRAVWGLPRHDWVEIHFYICAVFVALMLLHLILHWKWITHTLLGIGKPHARLRVLVALVLLAVLLGLAIVPFFGAQGEILEKGGRSGGHGLDRGWRGGRLLD